MNKKYIKTAAVLTAAIALAACSEDVMQTTGGQDSTKKTIEFHTTVAQNQDVTRAMRQAIDAEPIKMTGKDGRQLWLQPLVTATTPATRGTQLTSDSKMASFGVSAFLHDAPEEGTQPDLTGVQPTYFYNLQATETTGDNEECTGTYTIAQPYYWPSADQRLTFQAYYPYGNDNVKLADAAEDQGDKYTGAQRINVTIASSAKDQVDFMTAEAVSTNSFNASAKPGVDLAFRHHLVAVRFVIGDMPETTGMTGKSGMPGGYIKSININGVYSKGVYTVGSGWTLNPTDKSPVGISYMTGNTLDKPISGEAQQPVTADGETFLLIPQTFGASAEGDDAEEAKIIIVYHDGDDDYVVEGSLAGQDPWAEGTTVTYALSSTKLKTLRISTVEYPTLDNMPKDGWTEGDQIGMYVEGSQGTTLIHKNVPVTYVGGSSHWEWAVGGDEPIYHIPGQHYYFYYPYVEDEDQLPGKPLTNTITGQAATAFFNSVISQHVIASDQSSKDDLLGSDLMVSKGEDDIYSSTIKATMERQVAMARFAFAPSKTIPNTITYTNNANKQTSGSFTVSPSTNWNGFTPYLGSGGIYSYIVKANTSRSLNCASGEVNAWKDPVDVNLAPGTTNNVVTVYSVRNDWEFVNAIWQYNRSGLANTASAVYDFTIPANGTYTMECWGAAGGYVDNPTYLNNTSPDIYGRGAYTSGAIALNTNTNNGHLYIYIGGRGTNATSMPSATAPTVTCPGGFNGGGYGTLSRDVNDYSCGGGGATDIRLNNRATEWNSRIMVAAGGGGGQVSSQVPAYTEGMHGGNPNVTGKISNWNNDWTPIVNQTQGNGLGQGANGQVSQCACSGGGGGYQGGVNYAPEEFNTEGGRASGGSSFISGATSAGCSTVTGYAFDNATAVFKKGTDSTCPSKTIGGSPKALGQEDGYARITLIRD